MKTSLGHLPQRKAEELEILTKYIRRAVPAQMVILFGSYARGNWVELDERFDYGVHTTFQSDYDILVLVEHGVEPYGAARKLDRVEDVFARNTRSDTPVSFTLEHIQTFNKYLAEGRYFWTDIAEEGIMLYDNGKFTLDTPCELNAQEFKGQVQEYFEEWNGRGETFYKYAALAHSNKDHKFSIFNFHQACESFLHTIRLIHTLKKPRIHDLEKLVKSCKVHTPEILAFFPTDTEESKRLFKILNDAYIAARYDPKYTIAPADIDRIRPHVELLRQITRNAYDKKIAELDALIDSSPTK